MKKYEVVTVEASLVHRLVHQAVKRMRFANKFAHEHLRGEWVGDLFVVDVFEAEEDDAAVQGEST